MNPQYQVSGKLNVFDQLNIARKLSPALALVDAVVRQENEGKEKGVLIVMALGMLSDESSKFIVEKCMSLITRIGADGTVARIFVNGNLMFDDMTLTDLTDLTAKVIEDNLSNFLNTALPNTN
jgi:hypothetical protein